MPGYDLLLKNGYTVDPVNGTRELRQILIRDSRIYRNARHIGPVHAAQEIDLAGKTVIPGIIDTHVHLSGRLDAGYAMLARAGVTTAIDFSGPVSEVSERIKSKGSGINVGVLEALIPGKNLPRADCSKTEIVSAIERAQVRGALGIKIMGGHYPLTTDTTARIIDQANVLKTYIAFHAGTIQTTQPFLALREAVRLASGRQFHLAHINSYCRGGYKDFISEMCEAITLLENNRNIVSDSYLSNFNGTSGKCTDNEPVSRVTRNELARAGYDSSKAGLRKAIQDSSVYVCKQSEAENRLVRGEEALDTWQRCDTDVTISFSANPSINAVGLALHKRADNSFTVDSISTDGGGIPRNSIVHLGLPLTRYQDFSLNDFVIKTSIMPARMFNLKNKGHLQEGADADITVLDMDTFQPFMTIVGGQVIMSQGRVYGKGGTMITGARGRAYLEARRIDCQVTNIENGFLYDKSIR